MIWVIVLIGLVGVGWALEGAFMIAWSLIELVIQFFEGDPLKERDD